MGSILSLLMRKRLQVEWPKNIMEKNWEASCPFFMKKFTSRMAEKNYWKKTGSILSLFYEEKSTSRMAEKKSWRKIGQHFALFMTNCASRMAEKSYCTKTGSILSFFMRKCCKSNGPKNILEKIGQHFVPVHENISQVEWPKNKFLEKMGSILFFL